MKLMLKRATRPAQWGGLCLAAVMLTGCSVLGFHSGLTRVVDRGVNCGTTSQQSAVHYFATEADFDRWIDYRGIHAFGPGAAADDGVIVVEMGQRMTGGYEMSLLPDVSHIDNDTLYLGVAWTAPPHYAAISQAMTAPCIVVKPPQGSYSAVEVNDQAGTTRGTV